MVQFPLSLIQETLAWLRDCNQKKSSDNKQPDGFFTGNQDRGRERFFPTKSN